MAVRYNPHPDIVPVTPDLPEQASAPAAPASGYQRIYATDRRTLAHRDPDGLSQLMSVVCHAFPPATGKYTRGMCWGDAPSTNPSGVVEDTLYAMPFIIPWTLTLTAISMRVVTLSVGGLIRVGLYHHDPTNGSPGDLVVDAGTFSTTTTGVKDVATSVTILPGAYWGTFVGDAAAAATALLEMTILAQALALHIPSATMIPAKFCTRAFAYGALPDPWGTVDTWESTLPYRMLLKV